ncbi:hypothetical protein D3C77_706480 [compost metagenome]
MGVYFGRQGNKGIIIPDPHLTIAVPGIESSFDNIGRHIFNELEATVLVSTLLCVAACRFIPSTIAG